MLNTSTFESIAAAAEIYFTQYERQQHTTVCGTHYTLHTHLQWRN